MTAATLPAPIIYPWVFPFGNSSTFVIDTASEKAGAVIQSPFAGTIDQVGFYVSAFTSNSTVDVRIETVDGSGMPTGTLWATNTNGAKTVNATGWYDTTLTAGATVAKGDTFAVVISNPSVSYGNFTLVGWARGAAFRSAAWYAPYGVANTGTWSKNAAYLPNISLHISDSGGSYVNVPGVYPYMCGTASVTSLAYKTGTNPAEVGVYFQVPFACRCVGVWQDVALGAAGTFDAKLYDASNNVLASKTGLDTDDFAGPAVVGPNLAYFTAGYTLSPNTWYRATMFQTAGTTGATTYLYPTNTAALMACTPFGANWLPTKRAAGGAWTNYSTSAIYSGIIIDQLDDGAGGAAAGATIWDLAP